MGAHVFPSRIFIQVRIVFVFIPISQSLDLLFKSMSFSFLSKFLRKNSRQYIRLRSYHSPDYLKGKERSENKNAIIYYNTVLPFQHLVIKQRGWWFKKTFCEKSFGLLVIKMAGSLFFVYCLPSVFPHQVQQIRPGPRPQDQRKTMFALSVTFSQ